MQKSLEGISGQSLRFAVSLGKFNCRFLVPGIPGTRRGI
jgi:hypothetical protein